MINDNTPIKQRLYIHFGKFDALKYISNLDLAKVWERALRRADLPILYSQGFNPRPRIQLGSALPLGISSECEILDVSLRETIPLAGLVERIAATSPAGLRVYSIEEVPVRSPALQTQVRSAEYRVHFEDPVDLEALKSRISQLMEGETLERERERKGKQTLLNIRPLVYGLHLDEAGELIAHLAVGDQGNVRPDEILAALHLPDVAVSIHRFRLNMDRSG
jgi:radical SAM-linked protein